MNNPKRKNYRLILETDDKKLEIMRDTLLSIDDFTSCFQSQYSLVTSLAGESIFNYENYRIYIESSQKNKERVLYYKHRPILFEENKNGIIQIMSNKNVDDVKEYLEKRYNIKKYLKSENIEDLIKIPAFRLYFSMLLKNTQEYYSLLSLTNSDYRNYRDFALVLLNEDDMKKFKFNLTAEKKMEAFKKCKEVYQSTFDKIDVLSNEEEEVLDILNSYISVEEKYEELYSLLQDTDKYRYYVEKYKYLLNNQNNKHKM